MLSRLAAAAALAIVLAASSGTAHAYQGQVVQDQPVWSPGDPVPGCVQAIPCPPPPCPPRHAHYSARPKPQAPVHVQEAPVVHQTDIVEKIVVHHVVVELPTQVIAAAPPCDRCNQLPTPPTCKIGQSPCHTGQTVAQAAPQQQQWHPTVDCDAVGGTRTINPKTGNPTCFVPNHH